MSISVWYVYLDEIGEWLTEDVEVAGDTSHNWHDAFEFRSEDKAQAAAENHGGVVFGWCQ